MLFNFRSRYLYAIGLKEYLDLEVGASRIPAQYPVNGTLDTAYFLLSYPYVTITLCGITFQ